MKLFSRASMPQADAVSGPPDPPDYDASSARTRADQATIEIPRFGARKKAHELARELTELHRHLDRLGALEVIELERRCDTLRTDIHAQEAALVDKRREHDEALKSERDRMLASAKEELDGLNRACRESETKLSALRADVVTTEEVAVLQEAGVYTYRHPLDDSVAYKAELARISDQIRTMVKVDGGAVTGTTHWTVNGSASQGRKMVRDFSKLMLRAYNAEADTLVRGLKPYKLVSAEQRLGKVRETIARLGKTMDIMISAPYHRLRLRELELTADYLEKLAEEREREREERERLREERKVQQEMERERRRLEKERQHHENAIDALRANGDIDAVARLEAQLAEIDRKIEDVDYRAANVRAGYVYVISNIGAFGDGIVKVGLTRRLEPRDRIRELGDASVPFRFDVHALFFSQDAVGIESSLHARLADRRVNRVNVRREFFYATPSEVRQHLAELTGELLSFDDAPEALEFRQSQQSGLSISAAARTPE